MNYEELNRLDELRASGAITEEDYQRERERIFNAANINAQYQNAQYQNTQYQNAQYQDTQTQYYNTGSYNQNNDVKYGNVQYSNNVNPEQKSKIAAGLFGIFLGAFGVHNFYLGYTGKAVAQLLMTLLTCGLLGIVSSIWGLIEGIMILAGEINVDADGNPLRD